MPEKQEKEALTVHLLREHVAAKGDAALEGDRSKVGAMTALHLSPGLHGWNHTRDRRAQEV